MDSISGLITEIKKFNDERNWAPFHDPKNLAMAVASEAGELCGVLRWVANADADDFLKDAENRQKTADEIADVAILLLALCDRTGINLAQAVKEKLLKNGIKYPKS